MNTKKSFLPVIIGAGAIGAYYFYKFYAKKQTAKNLNIKLRTIKLDPISQAAVQIEIANPTPQDIVLNAISADLNINNTPISTLNYFKKTIIPANNSTSIDLRIQINPLEAISFFGDIFLNKAGLNEIAIKGTASAENLVIPFDITQKLKLF